MTNYEKYKAEIEPIARMGRRFAVERNTNKTRVCRGMKCDNCLFYDEINTNCDEVALEWADTEYIEPEPEVDWSKVAVDTPILVSDSLDGINWLNRHFAYFKDGKIFAFKDGTTSWSRYRYRNCTDDWTTSWEHAKLAEQEK